MKNAALQSVQRLMHCHTKSKRNYVLVKEIVIRFLRKVDQKSWLLRSKKQKKNLLILILEKAL
jgi:hypothetical protein